MRVGSKSECVSQYTPRYVKDLKHLHWWPNSVQDSAIGDLIQFETPQSVPSLSLRLITLTSLSRNRVQSTICQGVAPSNATYPKPCSFPWPPDTECVYHVGGAGGLEATLSSKMRGKNRLIDPHENNEECDQKSIEPIQNGKQELSHVHSTRM